MLLACVQSLLFANLILSLSVLKELRLRAVFANEDLFTLDQWLWWDMLVAFSSRSLRE